MTKQMSLKEITKKWVADNFDLNKERKTATKKTYNRRLYSLMDDGTYVFDDWVKQIQEELRLLREKDEPGIPLDAVPYISFDTEYDYGYCDCNSGSSDKTVEIYYEYEVPESDDDVIKRIMAREKAKIRRQREKEQQEANKAKQKEEELKLVRKLMKKHKIKEAK